MITDSEISVRDSTYLGDGAYVYLSRYDMWLFTSDGITITNRICLEPEVFNALLQFTENKSFGK